LRCGKEIKTVPNRVRDGRGKYCSKDCYNKSKPELQKGRIGKRRGEVKTCIICGKNFYVRPSRTHYKYCSIPCRNKDEEYWERVSIAVMKGIRIRPTSLEKQMMAIIKRYNLPYKYTGDGTFRIGRKYPDFVNINGEKKVIEVGNTYHHPPPYEENRTKFYTEHGWESHIFICNKLNENEIISRLGSDSP